MHELMFVCVRVCPCRLQQLGLGLSECSSLAELRVSHNSLQSLPQALSSNKRLKIIEAGANQIDDFDDIQVHRTLFRHHSISCMSMHIYL